MATTGMEFGLYDTTSVAHTYTEKAWLEIDFELYTRFIFVWEIVLGPIVCVLGIAGNILSMIVLSKDPNNKLQSVYFNLTSLLAFDIAFLFFGLLFSINEMVKFTHPHLEGNLLGSFLSFKGYIFMVLRHMTAMMLIVMSIERWMSLVFPYTVKMSCISMYPRTIMMVSFVIAAAYLIPFIGPLGSPPQFGGQQANSSDNSTMLGPPGPPAAKGPRGPSSPAFDAFVFVETIILHYIGPAILLIFNVAIVIAYRRFVSNRPSSSKKGDNQNRITLVVLGVASLYIVLTLPILFSNTLVFIDPDYKMGGIYESTFKFFIDLGDLFGQVYAATDFFVYILVSKRYREIFTSMVSIRKSDNSRKKTSRTDQLQSSTTNPETTVSTVSEMKSTCTD